MLDLIEQHRPQIAALCKRHNVKHLELFGSAAAGTFTPGKSDLDFFVEYTTNPSRDVVEDWFGLQEDLEKLFNCSIDLVSTKDAKNPYFLRLANQHRVTLYAA